MTVPETSERLPDEGPFETMDHRTFQKFADLVYAKAGIHLGEKKEALVQARVTKRMRQIGLRSFRDYYRLVAEDESGNEVTLLLDSIATNVTHFFREKRHFDILATLLKKWADQGQSRFRIWCAAASTGQEPYTIAMTVCESLSDVRDTKILATDISTKALAKAREAVYSERDVKDIPRNYLSRYFFKEKNGTEIAYRVTPTLRNMITFARLNLSDTSFPMKGPFDVIFCRNVMIYFDNTIRKRLLDNCFHLLKQNGYLMVGHAESLSGMLSNFKSVEPALYIKS